MKLYIAAHSQEEAREVAELCRERGHSVTSRWLDEANYPAPNTTEADRTRIAVQDVEDVLKSDGLVLLASPCKVSGGKFVEAGVAMGQGKPVFVLGRQENMLLWHPLVRTFSDAETFLETVPV